MSVQFVMTKCLKIYVPVTAIQSFTTIPAPTTGEPLLMLPATRGTCSKLDSSSWSWTEVLGCTMPPWLLSDMYEPTRTLSAMVWRKTSTPSTSAILLKVSFVVRNPTWTIHALLSGGRSLSRAFVRAELENKPAESSAFQISHATEYPHHYPSSQSQPIQSNKVKKKGTHISSVSLSMSGCTSAT